MSSRYTMSVWATPWGGTYRSWNTLPRLFALIFCGFPEHKVPSQPSEVRHPTLVLGILRNWRLKCWALDVVFGTSNNLKMTTRAHIDFIIQDLKAAKTCGLHRPTRFDLQRRKVIPWSTDFFSATPVGYL